jgi:hypothetical protein
MGADIPTSATSAAKELLNAKRAILDVMDKR